MGAQILNIESIPRRYLLQMNGIVEVVQPEGSWPESGERLIEEAAIRRRIRAVGGEVHGRGVDMWVGGYIGYGGQKVVHHAGIVGVVDGGSNKPRLEDVAPEEASAKGHILQMQQGSSVGEHRIHVDLLDVRLVGHRVHGHEKVRMVLDGAVIRVHLVELPLYLIKGIPGLPLVLGEHAHGEHQHKKQIAAPQNRRREHFARLLSHTIVAEETNNTIN